MLVGTASGSYTMVINVGKVTSYSFSVTAGTTYYCVLQAYNTAGVYSPYSAEVVVTVPDGTVSGGDSGGSSGGGASGGGGGTLTSQWQVLGVGDFNGDGHADALWFDANTGTLAEWLLDGRGNVMAALNVSLTCGAGCYPQWRVLGVGDFNGDGYADVLWFNANTGTLAEWLLDGHGNVMAAPNLSLTCGSGCSSEWQVLGVGDFNGDGFADVLWFNANTGILAEWLLDGDGNVIAVPAPNLSLTCGAGCSPQWRVLGVGDFNGDGFADLLWFNTNTGTLAEWLLDGQGNVMAAPNLSVACGSGCSPQWQVLGVGDFNGDGHADVLWFNGNTGILAEWLLDGQGKVMAAPNLSQTCGSGCSY